MQQPCFLYISGSEGDGLQILTKCKLKRMGIYYNKTTKEACLENGIVSS